jgi:hypothetical protein
MCVYVYVYGVQIPFPFHFREPARPIKTKYTIDLGKINAEFLINSTKARAGGHGERK